MPAALAALALLAAVPDGRHLAPGEACYAITGPVAGGGRVMGATWQAVKADRIGGRPVWRIVVHQRMPAMSFDMRDAFVLDAGTLRPLSLETTFNGKPRARLNYTADRVTGARWDRTGAAHPVDQPLAEPAWEGDLYGLTFAALPLAPGASFRLPFFQYDKGLGVFTLKVTGSEPVETPAGTVEAWVVNAGPSADARLDYLISKADHRELGYRSAEGGQRLGGDCAGLT